MNEDHHPALSLGRSRTNRHPGSQQITILI